MKSINIKSNWNEITYKEFIKIREILESDAADEIKQIRLVAVLTNETDAHISDMKMVYFRELLTHIKFLTEEPKKNKLQKSYTINNHKYNVKVDAPSISTAQYIDYQALIKENNELNLVSLWFVPDGHEYGDGYDIEEVREDINQMSICDIMSVAFFLRAQFATSILITADYLKNKLNQLGIPEETISKRLTHFNNMASSLLS